MSSHHVVREKQEPALLVLGLNDFADEMLGQLLEWSPTVIAACDAAEKLDTRGIKIDYIIGKEHTAVLQSDVKQIVPGHDTVARSALQFLTDNGYPSVNIVTDDPDLGGYEPFAGRINLVVFHNRKKIYPVKSGFSKWQPAGVTIEILTLAADLQITGLSPAGGQEYTTISDGFFTICFNTGIIFIAEGI